MRLGCVFLLLLASCSRDAPRDGSSDPGTVAADSEARAAMQYTQSFYEWYGPSGRLETVVRDSGHLFAPALLGALREDFAAQAANADEIVGLDWDPFLASQDPCPPYQAVSVNRRNDTLRVGIRASCGDSASLAVIANVVRANGGFVFADFEHGSDSGSLVKDLAALRASRDSMTSGKDNRP